MPDIMSGSDSRISRLRFWEASLPRLAVGLFPAGVPELWAALSIDLCIWYMLASVLSISSFYGLVITRFKMLAWACLSSPRGIDLPSFTVCDSFGLLIPN